MTQENSLAHAEWMCKYPNLHNDFALGTEKLLVALSH